MKKTLLVYASDNGSLVSNLEALESGLRRFVGLVFDPEINGFVKKSEPEKLPYRNEYKQALMEGDLIPADQETAKICGLKF